MKRNLSLAIAFAVGLAIGACAFRPSRVEAQGFGRRVQVTSLHEGNGSVNVPGQIVGFSCTSDACFILSE
jgi:hypothetical protein